VPPSALQLGDLISLFRIVNSKTTLWAVNEQQAASHNRTGAAVHIFPLCNEHSAFECPCGGAAAISSKEPGLRAIAPDGRLSEQAPSRGGGHALKFATSVWAGSGN